MKSTRSHTCLVWVTTPNLRTARKLARLALEQRLVACAQLRPGVESHFWWQGKCRKSLETLITFKTTIERTAALEKMVLAEHPYDTPQFVVVRISQGNSRFLEWIAAETADTPPRHPL